MKKEYSKPLISYESFELSQSIAEGCEVISNYGNGMCVLTISEEDGLVFFTDSISGCRITSTNLLDGICYDVPSDYSQVFTS